MKSSDESAKSPRQHTKPCCDCPWRRTSLPGWLGGMSPDDWVAVAMGDEPTECHTLHNAHGQWQCAGLATFRRNVCKLPRNRGALRLAPDKETVFATPTEFKEHHQK